MSAAAQIINHTLALNLCISRHKGTFRYLLVQLHRQAVMEMTKDQELLLYYYKVPIRYTFLRSSSPCRILRALKDAENR